ncbi:hypothetical protein [Catenulispora rubra]|uniref:hypothetical protein n=1 Tax=Catenulispora rubra TaxID=280293 RepID=UPI001891FA49|nr:hypothetical protein [Catenulispora rubra]
MAALDMSKPDTEAGIQARGKRVVAGDPEVVGRTAVVRAWVTRMSTCPSRIDRTFRQHRRARQRLAGSHTHQELRTGITHRAEALASVESAVGRHQHVGGRSAKSGPDQP